MNPQRLIALDGLRGLAAIAVMVFHLTNLAQPVHGYLAVDLFFMLSGFVLASAYEDRFVAGMTVRAFMGQRIARLYPAYLIGLIFAFAVLAPRLGLDATWAFAANLCFIPYVGHDYWLDPVTWSLSLELLVNLLFAFGLWRLSTRALAILTALGGALYLIVSQRLGGASQFGGQSDLACYFCGYARGLFGFPLGWLVWRLRHQLAGQATAWASRLAFVALAVALLAPGEAAAHVAVVVLFPLVLAAVAFGPQPVGRLSQAATIAGAISYPLYVIHVDIAHLLDKLPMGLAITGVAAPIAAWAIHRTIEPSGRRLLSRLFSAHAPRTRVATA
jgi:peptidoglycan/LPS O-acetylase OafA/YrhL